MVCKKNLFYYCFASHQALGSHKKPFLLQLPPVFLGFQSFCALALQIVSAFLVLGLVFLNTWYIGGVFANTLQWNPPLLVLLSLFQVLLLFLEKDKPYRLNSFLCSFLGFLLYVGINAYFISPVPTLAKREGLFLCQVFLASQLIYSLWDSLVFKKIVLLGCVGIIVLQVGVAFYQYYLNPYWLPENLRLPVYSGRSSGTFGSPNHFSGLISLAFFPVFTAFFSKHSPKGIRFLLVLSCGILLWALSLAFSRGAFLGLAFGLFFLPLLMTQRKGFVASYSLWILIGGILFGSLFYFQLHVFQSRLHFALEEGVDSMRLAFWKAALYLFVEQPILGQGAASFNDLFERFRPLGFVHEPIWVHNEYLNTLSDYGLLGFSLVLFPLVFSLVQSFKALKIHPDWLSTGLFLSLMAYAVHCFFDFNCRIPGLFLTAALVYTRLLKLQALGEWTLPKPYSLLGPCFALGLVYLAWPYYQADVICQKVETTLYKSDIEDKSTPSNSPYKAWEKELLTGLAWDTNHDALWFKLSQVYYGLHTLDGHASFKAKSLSSIEKALEHRPIYWIYWVHYALGLIAGGEVSKALGALQTALNLAPFQWRAWYYYAFCLKIENTRPDKSLEAIEHCLFLNAKNPLAESLRTEIQSQLALPPTPSS